jgi:protein O-GlcNAc transferase
MTQIPIQQVLDAAIQHHQAGKFLEAEIIYQEILAQFPDHADALHLLGVLYKQKSQNQLAADLIGKAIALNPSSPIYFNNMGSVLLALGRPDEAVEAYRSALKLKSDYAQAHNNLGNALKEQGHIDIAIDCYHTALKYKPDLPEAYNNLGIVLQTVRRFDQAVDAYHTAIRLRPDYAEAQNNLGSALKNQGRWTAAIAASRKAVQIDPTYTVAASNLVYDMQFHPDFDAKAIHEELCRWNRQHAEPLKRFIKPHSNNRDPDRRLKIGYVSPDFRHHPVGYNLLPLLELHDHLKFEIFCYSTVIRPDALTKRMQLATDAWRNILGNSDEQVTEMIRNDHIDILVDLSLHMEGNRLLVFARKPAPIQVTFMGYPGSTGLDTIDYRLTDPHLDPPGMDDAYYSEESIRLPNTFWCYDPLAEEPYVNELPAIKNGYVTFGCLNNFCKVNDGVFKLWTQVLTTVPHSHLIILAPEGHARQWMLDQFSQDGIAPERIEFTDLQPRQEYLKLYHRIDIGLDTQPYNGHTTNLDSFWMGVPVVSLAGRTAVGRGGKSVLTNLGMPELIAQTFQHYVEIAVKLASDLLKLREIRETLRQRMQKSPLMDAKRFTGNIEVVYRDMWRKWCE